MQSNTIYLYIGMYFLHIQIPPKLKAFVLRSPLFSHACVCTCAGVCWPAAQRCDGGVCVQAAEEEAEVEGSRPAGGSCQAAV